MRARTEIEIFELRWVLVLPYCLAGFGVERDDDLFRVPRTSPLAAVAHAIHREQPAPVRDDRRVPRTERSTPDHGRPCLRPRPGKAGRIDDEVAIGPTPLSPRSLRRRVLSKKTAGTSCQYPTSQNDAHEHPAHCCPANPSAHSHKRSPVGLYPPPELLCNSTATAPNTRCRAYPRSWLRSVGSASVRIRLDQTDDR